LEENNQLKKEIENMRESLQNQQEEIEQLKNEKKKAQEELESTHKMYKKISFAYNLLKSKLNM